MSHNARQTAEARLETDGFPELRRHWLSFIKMRSDAVPVSTQCLVDRTTRHVELLFGYPKSIALSLMLLAISLAWLYLQLIRNWLDGLPFYQSGPNALLFLIGAWIATNFFFLLMYCMAVVQRRLREPMEPLLADWIGWLLQQDSLAMQLRKNPFAKGEKNCLEWESQGWSRCLVRSGAAWEISHSKSPEELVRHWLLAFLGTKDSIRRKFVAGTYLNSLRDGKASVTRFCAKFAIELKRSSDGLLPISEGLLLLENLLSEEVLPETEPHKVLARFIEAAKKGTFVPDNAIESSIWKRDPFRDLTSQREFYSSASLRGIDRMGRSSKGRLGTIGYLINPSIFAIDFTMKTRRCVRARVAIVREKFVNPDASICWFLYVDGIEGSNAIPVAALHEAIITFASEHQLSGVFYNQFPYNRTPQRVVKWASQRGSNRQVNLIYSVNRDREYLDAFGWPFEPFEYAVPKGNVVGYWFCVEGCCSCIGSVPSFCFLLYCRLRMHSLWILMIQGVLFALLATSLTVPVMVPVLLLLAGVGLAMHLNYQRSSLKTPLQS